MQCERWKGEESGVRVPSAGHEWDQQIKDESFDS